MKKTVTSIPKVGDGATLLHWTDRTAGTVIEVSVTGYRVRVQEDTAKRIDSNGMSEVQEYEYTPNPHGHIHTFTRRSDGYYRATGTGYAVKFGVRRAYYDFSF